MSLLAVTLGMQAMAADYIITSDDTLYKYTNDPTYNQQDTILHVVDGVTLTIDNYDPENSFKGTLAVEGSVTLNIPTYCTEKPDGEMFSFGALTFGAGAQISIDLSDAVLDVIMSHYDMSGGEYTFQNLLDTTKNMSNWNFTLSDDTVSRLATRGIEVITTSNPMDMLAEGKGGLYSTKTVSQLMLGKPVVTPEPATATLSLLALAGLAARRRRH